MLCTPSAPSEAARSSQRKASSLSPRAAYSKRSRGWVIVGSLPTTDGTAATAKAGCLLILNSPGHVVETFSGTLDGAHINGPWDMTALDLGEVAELFVSNVLNGTVAAHGSIVHQGTVVRLVLFIPTAGMPQEIARTTIGSGSPEKAAPAAGHRPDWVGSGGQRHTLRCRYAG
jgi:hypothetical protein